MVAVVGACWIWCSRADAATMLLRRFVLCLQLLDAAPRFGWKHAKNVTRSANSNLNSTRQNLLQKSATSNKTVKTYQANQDSFGETSGPGVDLGALAHLQQPSGSRGEPRSAPSSRWSGNPHSHFSNNSHGLVVRGRSTKR
uniref:DUF4005 domain-containing protein n=1 Tax=Oryza punctata TaxID=4537 RepID=A0A0E0JXF9_ORYPU